MPLPYRPTPFRDNAREDMAGPSTSMNRCCSDLQIAADLVSWNPTNCLVEPHGL